MKVLNANILIVEDELFNQKLILKYLSQSNPNFNVFATASAEEALELLENHSFDLILMDWQLPEMSGIEAVHYLKNNPKTAQIPIIMQTSATDNEDLSDAFQAGVIDYIKKPIHPLELNARVDSALALHEARLKLLEMNTNLENIISERTQKLRQVYKELDTFFYHSSHSLLRPVKTIDGILQLLPTLETKEEILKMTENIAVTTLGMESMIRKLVFISEIDTEEELEEINFAEMIRQFSNYLESRNIRFTTNITTSTKLYSYTYIIEQMLFQLIENSYHFHQEDNPFVHIKTSTDKGITTILVEDNGEGISKELMSKIFQPYFRASQRSEGTGLGLYLVHKSLEKLGGEIFVDSKVLVGTKFILTLPDVSSELT